MKEGERKGNRRRKRSGDGGEDKEERETDEDRDPWCSEIYPGQVSR